jgi:hypothetical protein
MERLKLMKFKLTYADNCRLLNDQMAILNQAYEFLLESNELKLLLEVALPILFLCFVFVVDVHG